MNVADFAIVLLVLAALPAGALAGGMLQLGFFGGFGGGVALGMGVSLVFVTLPDTVRGVLALFVTFGVASGLAALGVMGGTRVRTTLRETGWAHADAGVGVVVAGIVALLAAWLLSAPLAIGSESVVARQLRGSAVVGALDAALPPPATLFGGVWALMGVDPVPPVYAQLEPAEPEAVALPSEAQVDQAVAAARESVVRVVADGCPGGAQEGSGFAVAPNLVVASAHVVAGTDDPLVGVGGGQRRSTPVLFDPGLDVAILRVPGLDARPLPLAPETVARGTTAALLGYPVGFFAAHPAAVLQHASVLAPDVPGGATQREVYQLRTDVVPGLSGGPLVRPDGTVLGVVFSRSLANPRLGYAVTSPAVAERVTQARRQSPQVAGTGECREKPSREDLSGYGG